MFTQLLLPLAPAFLLFILWLVLRRRDTRAQAREDFTQFMTVIDDWSRKHGDYQLTGRAINALAAHNDRIMLAEQSLKPTWLGSPAQSQYLAEYRLCLARHQTLLTDAISDESATAQAKELESAIQELNTHLDRKNS